MILFGYPLYCPVNTFEVGTQVHLQESVSSFGRLCKVHRVGESDVEVEFRPGVTAILQLDRCARLMTPAEVERFKTQQS